MRLQNYRLIFLATNATEENRQPRTREGGAPGRGGEMAAAAQGHEREAGRTRD